MLQILTGFQQPKAFQFYTFSLTYQKKKKKEKKRTISSREEGKLPCTILQVLNVSMVPLPSKRQFYVVRKYLAVPWESTLYLFDWSKFCSMKNQNFNEAH